jgi:beta-lactamase superfamily II metal-dependent hydrolase
MFFVWRSRVVVAALASLLCWVMLGVTAVCIEEQPRRADHILSLLDAWKINIKSPLRYYGRLADEPKILPWGTGYDIELSGVDYEGSFVPASGGLRLGYIAQIDRAAPLTLHTGDVIAVLTRAKLPQVFRDEGAFDRRAYLAQQGVDLVGALRAPELLKLIRPARPSMFAWVSRGRWRLREEVDVGQGDSLFVVLPAGKTLLIDGGGAFGGFPGQDQVRGIDPGEEAVSPYLWSRGFKKIDVVALTHAHQDHVRGLSAILENFRVGRLWIGREVNNPALAKLETLARERNIPIEYEMRGKQFSLDEVQGEFLWPEISKADTAATAKNNDSLVLKLKYRNRTLLLPGDVERQAEHAMLEQNSADLHADVLKVGHHGSKNSTTQEFLDAVEPTIAIISSGEDNPYGHPGRELLERLEASGARVLRTDRDGAVHIVTDGDRLEISCFVACPEVSTVTTSKGAEAPNQNQNNQ